MHLDGCQAIASDRQACEVEAATAEDCALQGCCWDAKAAAAADAGEAGSIGEAAPPVDDLLADGIKLCYQKIGRFSSVWEMATLHEHDT